MGVFTIPNRDNQPFVIPVIGGATGPTGPGGGSGGSGISGPARYFLRYTHGGGVPDGADQYLRLGVGVFSSEDGDLLVADGRIRGISVAVNVVDASRSYQVEVLSDPSGAGGTGPTVEATLALPSSTLRARDRTFAVAVPGLLDLGVRLVQTAGAGDSTFDEIVVLVEVSIP
jgi:hypothetical protein